MCGIFSVISVADSADDGVAESTAENPVNAANQVLAGLKRLEYRGYDSWGVATVASGQFQLEKHVGKISQVEAVNLPATATAIGHTRWATHGGITVANAHPHQAKNGSFVLAQNGIVQNFQALKQKLAETGYEFVTETDTEVIVALLEQLQAQQPETDVVELMRQAFSQLEGRNTIIVLTADGRVLAARNGSPLVVGLVEDGSQIFVSSDTLSFADVADHMIVLENGQQVVVANGQVEVFEIATGQQVAVQPQMLDATADRIDKEGYDHFMLKEIHESPAVIRQVAAQDQAELEKLADAIKAARRVYTIGSGTAGIAAAQLAYYLRAYGGVEATSLVGADAVEYYPLLTDQDLLIAPSQSGETADVLEVLEIAQAKGVKLATYVNMQGASMTRMADFPFMAGAGPEICVMSTKVFVSQVAWGYLVAKAVQGQYQAGHDQLVQLADQVEADLNSDQRTAAVKNLAQDLAGVKDIFLLAKAQNYQIIREGMVKLIEGSYKHAHALPAGDLKHYAITLMEQGVPVLVVTSRDAVASDVLNAAHEVKARGATVIGFGPETDLAFDTYIPVTDTGETSAISAVIPLQLLAYYLTVELGNDVDHPRNIAKSVTVK